jgi:hypothetical protein
VKRQIQVLLAWFEPRDAVSALLGFRLPAQGEDISMHAAAFQQKLQALNARDSYADLPMTPGELPLSLAKRGDAILRSMLGIANDSHAGRFSVATVDLTRLISFQKAITLENEPARFEKIAPGDWEALFELCLPQDRVEEDLLGTFDKDGKGVTITSTNPNLRIGPVQSVDLPGATGVKLLGFAVIFGTPHMHVVEYKGRYFLKDGYHRSFALLSRGITQVPVVLERGRSFADVHAGNSSFIAPEHLLGDHPPMVTDFLDPAVSATVWQRAFRKVIRIRAEDFVINL